MVNRFGNVDSFDSQQGFDTQRRFGGIGAVDRFGGFGTVGILGRLVSQHRIGTLSDVDWIADVISFEAQGNERLSRRGRGGLQGSAVPLGMLARQYNGL